MTPESAIAPEGTILIIDDSPDNLRVLSKTLSTYGYAVRCVTNGAMALISIQNLPPDLILLDIRMPGVNGYEICQQLKRNPDVKDIPIIFLSALDDVRDIVKAFQVGGVDYITKPFQTEEVLARIQNQLTIQKLRKQLSEQNQHLLQEIDDRKKTEQALYQEIQRRILIEASLQDAKNTAEAANDAKSEFLAQMSHELRTPLNVILGFTTLMRSDATLPPTHQNYLATIDDSARRLLKLINNILTLTYAEASQLHLNEQEFDLHHLLDAAVTLWQAKAIEKGLQFEFQRSAAVPQYIQSDESKLRQILMNLLDNAIQITLAGYITVNVDIEHHPTDVTDLTSRLIIEVHDTGTGIAFGPLDTAFNVFSKIPPDASLPQEPALSLLLIRQFAQLMGGDVLFQNFPDQGNLVKVHILVKSSVSPSVSTPISVPTVQHVVQSLPDEGTLTRETLEVAMSDDWLAQLHQAAVKGFDQQIFQLIQKIPTSHAPLAKTLELWTRNFQFDRIIEITQQGIQ
ncbi:MAG: response regulator [Leptolyngbyaceae cyanobacterium bins.349]|nr:response regulator [Leptolyngbyaceae cyanobacterium bins.349]